MEFDDVYLTVGQTAATMAVAEGFHSEPYITRQLRHLIQNGGILPAHYRGEGRSAAALLDFPELLAASLQTYLVRSGFAIEHMAEIRLCMNNVSSAPASVKDAEGWTRSLRGVAEQIIKGEEWCFCLHMPRNIHERPQEDEAHFMGSWSRGYDDGGAMVRILKPVTMVMQGQRFAEPLINALRGGEMPAE